MSANIRWSGVAIGLGLCTAYTLWGPAKPVARETTSAGFKPPFSLMPKTTASPPAPAHPLPPSVLKFNPLGVDFGEVPSYEKRAVVVAVENPGPKPVTVINLTPSCGCLQAEMKNKTIAPGKSENAEISIIASPREWKGELTATLSTDEPGQTALKCKGSIRQEFLVEPLTLNFDRLGKRESRTLQALIKHYKGAPFEIKNITTKNEEFQFKWEPVAGGQGAAYTIFATATGKKTGFFSDAAAIFTNHPKVPVVPLGLSLRVIGDVSCAPGTVWSKQAPENEAEVFETTVRRITPGSLEIQKVTDAKYLPVEFSCQRIDESTLRLKIKPARELAKQAPWGNFLVYTNVEEQPVQLPYFVKLRQLDPVAK